MNKPYRPQARRLAELVGKAFDDAFRKQGFAAREIVTRWPEIVGEEIAAHAEPIRMQWPRSEAEAGEPGTLVLRVEGPAAIEIQHLSGVVLERVNRFFGWQAANRLVLRQAPLLRRKARRTRPAPDPEAARYVAKSLDIRDNSLRAALGRLGAAVKGM